MNRRGFLRGILAAGCIAVGGRLGMLRESEVVASVPNRLGKSHNFYNIDEYVRKFITPQLHGDFMAERPLLRMLAGDEYES